MVILHVRHSQLYFLVPVAFAAALALVVVDADRADAGLPTRAPIDVQGIDDGTSATVRASTSRQHHLYVGGEFGSAGGRPHDNTAAIDMTTGRIDHRWRVDTDGAVYAMVAAPDGSAIYLGGAFTTVNGVARPHLAKVHPVTGRLLDDQIDLNGSVLALAAHRDRLYVGGDFSEVDGRTRRRLVAIEDDTVVWDWVAHANGRVRDITLTSTGQALYVAGSFNTLDGSSAAGRVGWVRARDGERLPFDLRFNNSYTVIDAALSDDERTIYLAVGGPGSRGGNRTRAVRAADGALLWEYDHQSDSQALAVSEGVLYVGGHFDLADGGDGRARLLALDPVTGALLPWAPRVNSVFGVWDLDASPWGLVAVGDFTMVDGGRHGHVAVFDQVVFEAPPTPRPQCRATVHPGGLVIVRWGEWMGEETFLVRRDGRHHGRVDDGRRAFADRSPAPGQHRYVVRVKEIGVITDIDCGTVRVPAPMVECRVTVRANGLVELRWDRWPEEDTYVVRRGGMFLAKIRGGGLGHTDTPAGPGRYDYSIRIKHNRITRDVPCGPVRVPQAEHCRASIGSGGGVELRWRRWPAEDTYIVRRDGDFLAKVTGGGVRYTDLEVEPGAHSYLIRVKDLGVVTNIPCGVAIVS